ncbi:MAG: hypothetical protein ACRC92_07975 [Peptostreptococcaceae bacterium]
MTVDRIQEEARLAVEEMKKRIKEEIANEKSEKEIKEEAKQGSIRNARCLLSILEMKNEGKKITQKYKIVYLFSHYFDPADIAEVLEVRFQVVRKHITDELGMGLREFNKLPMNKQGGERRLLQDKYPLEVK